MTGQTSPKTSLRARSRRWTSFACIGTTLIGLLALSQSHYLHGGLCMVAALVLLKESSLVRRARATDADAAPALTPSRPLRKAA